MTVSNQFAPDPSLRDRVVLITGGASGIGTAMVEEFSVQGAKVALLDLAAEPTEELIRSLERQSTHTSRCERYDFTDICALRSPNRQVADHLGEISILVNDAVNDDMHEVKEMTPECWDDRMNVKLRHHFFPIQALSSVMRSAGRRWIINISSIVWMIPSTGLPAYVTAKAAILGLTRAMAHQLRSLNPRPDWT